MTCNHKYKTPNTTLSIYKGYRARRRNKICQLCNKRNTSYELSKSDLDAIFSELERLKDSEAFLLGQLKK